MAFQTGCTCRLLGLPLSIRGCNQYARAQIIMSKFEAFRWQTMQFRIFAMIQVFPRFSLAWGNSNAWAPVHPTIIPISFSTWEATAKSSVRTAQRSMYVMHRFLQNSQSHPDAFTLIDPAAHS